MASRSAACNARISASSTTASRSRVTYFDASTESASVALVLDASPSVLRESDEMKNAARALVDALSSSDQTAVVDFSAHTYLQLPFSGDGGLVRKAVARVDARSLLGDLGGSNIYEAVFLTARELFAKRTGRKAIVLLTDGQDSELGLTLDPATRRPSRRMARRTASPLKTSRAPSPPRTFRSSPSPPKAARKS